MDKRIVYLDNMANTPVDPRVVEAIIPHLKGTYGNPLNIHDPGQATSEIIETARLKMAELINAKPREIIFTSCGSESNNFAVKGLAKANEKKGRHIITSAIEHFSVLYPMQQLEKEGFKVTYIPVDQYGLVDPVTIEAAITPQTTLISITHASNEIGTIEPIAEIAKISKAKGVLFHVDGVQTVGNIPVNVVELGVDAMSFAANMFYGPTGIAGLYVRGAVHILPFILGGTQEDGRRAGSANIPGVVGMGRAAELAKMEMQDRMGEMIPLRDKLLNELPLRIKDFNITGHPTMRLPGHASGHAKYVEGESLSMFLNMEGIAVSTGSACASKALKASHVLLALGVSETDVHGSLVFSIGKATVEQDIDLVLEKLPPIVERLRAMSPMKG